MSQTLVTVIRHSLAAATAALDLLENSPQNVAVKGCAAVQRVVEAAPVVEELPVVSPDAEEPVPSATDILVNALNDSRWRLRTVAELAELAGINEWEVINYLSAADVSVVTKKRRYDQAVLVGLSSRN